MTEGFKKGTTPSNSDTHEINLLPPRLNGLHYPRFGGLRWKAALLLFSLLTGGNLHPQTPPTSPAQAWRIRKPSVKPAHTAVNPAFQSATTIQVKFKEGLKIRLRGGAPADLNAGVGGATNALQPAQATLAQLAASGAWERMHGAPEAGLDALQASALQCSGRQVANLNLWFYFRVLDATPASAIIDQLNALDCVEIAQPAPLEAPLPAAPAWDGFPLPPERTTRSPENDAYLAQGYLNPALEGDWQEGRPSGGIDARHIWGTYGTFGAGIKLVDVEYNFNSNHQDLPFVGKLGQVGTDPSITSEAFKDHGTAALGEVVMQSNGGGGTGIAPGCQAYISYVRANSASGTDIPNAISRCLQINGGPLESNSGHIIMIEQQLIGPNGGSGNHGPQFGVVPVEWDKGIFDVIQIAATNGVVVVEAAGNGQQNLDDSIYTTGNGGHYPFVTTQDSQGRYVRTTDSGAIIVGAGYPDYWFGASSARGRLGSTNYGTGVDLQGWGAGVLSAGGDANVGSTDYNDAYSSEGKNLAYTRTFAGTSSATPIVAGACVLMQAAHHTVRPSFLSAPKLRKKLKKKGQPQRDHFVGPATQNIGPLPDLKASTVYLSNPPPSAGASDNPMTVNYYNMYWYELGRPDANGEYHNASGQPDYDPDYDMNENP